MSQSASNTSPLSQGKTATPLKAGRPKSLSKRHDILVAASHLFLEQGFSATSMDTVASKAGVSKQTVYSHFSNKDALFIAVINTKCEEYCLDKAHLGNSALSPRVVLTDIGHQFVNLLQDPSVVAMYRVVIGEVSNNPRVAELFYEAGPQQAIDAVALYLQNNETLKLDTHLAHRYATHFFNLLKGEFHMRSMLALTTDIKPASQDEWVDSCVEGIFAMLSVANKATN